MAFRLQRPSQGALKAYDARHPRSSTADIRREPDAAIAAPYLPGTEPAH